MVTAYVIKKRRGSWGNDCVNDAPLVIIAKNWAYLFRL
jgi:hypothetical protein